jgi:hypothetical protein
LALKNAHMHLLGAKQFRKTLSPGPRWPGAAAVQVEGGYAILRVRMAGEVRFCEKGQASHAAWRGKLPPRRVANQLQVQLSNDTLENCAQVLKIAQGLRAAACRVDHPLRTNDYKRPLFHQNEIDEAR